LKISNSHVCGEDKVLPEEKLKEAEWRAIPGYEGRYEVSDSGAVRSLSTYRSTSGGELTPWTANKGYRYVSLRSVGSAKKSFAVHRLVLEAFEGPCPVGKQVAHWDGDPSNNHISNLRWATARENIADRTRHGRTAVGAKNGSAKLDQYTVKTIKRMKDCGFSTYETARLACVSSSTIDDIWSGETWKHV
jgi:hypothetical protein